MIIINIKIPYETEYETNKQNIYIKLKTNNLRIPFKQTFLNKEEILEILMYSNDKLENIITGKPNKQYNIRNNFQKIQKEFDIH